jgi:hypothetical protein
MLCTVFLNGILYATGALMKKSLLMRLISPSIAMPALLLWVGFTSAALAQTNPACADPGGCANDDGSDYYPASPLCYPMVSDQYAVQ